MAGANLTSATDYAGLFRRRVLTNAHYWGDFVAGHIEDVAALDGERDGIIKAITFGLDLADAWPLVAELMANFSPHVERRGTWEGWNGLLERAVEQAQQTGDLAAAVHLSTLLARLCQRQCRPAETIRHYRRVMRLAHRLGDDFSLARACTNLGYLYIEQRGRWQRAEILCCRALAIFERLNSDHGRAHTENHLGILYTRQGRWEQAIPRLERACAIWQTIGDQHGLMRGFINQSTLYLEMEDADKGLSCLNKALQQARLTGEEGEIGTIYMNFGFAHWLKGELVEAEAYSRQAEAIFRHFSNSLGLAELWGDLGRILGGQGRWHEAKSYLEASIEMWRALGNEFGEIRTRLYMVRYNLAGGKQRQVAVQLNELEHLIQQHGEESQRRFLHLLLTKYRYDLMGDSTRITEVLQPR